MSAAGEGASRAGWDRTRRAILRDALAIGAATGAYAVSFGAISTATGLTLLQTCVLSAVMFTGASQFALVGVLAAGGGPPAAAATAILLGTRNALYGLRLSSLLRLGGWRRPAAAHWVIDESTAMAIARNTEPAGRFAFWATGGSVFVFWNLLTLAGAVGARALSDPRVLGLDAAAPAAYLALLAPRLRAREPLAVGLTAAVVAAAAVPVLPPGGPILLAALVALGAGLRRRRSPAPGPEARRS